MAVLLLAALALAAQAPAAPPAPPPPACAAPEHRQFDFWVGRWDVYPTGTERLVAHSLIERLYGDCVIRESWMPLRGGGGEQPQQLAARRAALAPALGGFGEQLGRVFGRAGGRGDGADRGRRRRRDRG